MKCMECSGYMEVTTSNYLKKGGFKARRYKCRECGYKIETVELSRKEYARQNRLLAKVNVAIADYVKERTMEGL